MQVANTLLSSTAPAVDTSSLNLPLDGNAEAVAESFESVFASLLIKEMRNTLSEGFFGSEQSDIMGGMFDMHIGKAMTEGRGLGIREMVLAQLETQATQR